MKTVKKVWDSAKCRWVVVAGGSVAVASQAHATIDTALTGAVSDASGFFTGNVEPLVLTVVIFGIGITYLKLIKRR